MRRSIPKRAYTAEYREAAVRRVIDGGRGLADVARSLEISHKTLGNWVRLARAQKPLVKRELVPDPAAVELSRLRAENARLRMDNAILKKAAAYFAKESLEPVRNSVCEASHVEDKEHVCLQHARRR